MNRYVFIYVTSKYRSKKSFSDVGIYVFGYFKTALNYFTNPKLYVIFCADSVA